MNVFFFRIRASKYDLMNGIIPFFLFNITVFFIFTLIILLNSKKKFNYINASKKFCNYFQNKGWNKDVLGRKNRKINNREEGRGDDYSGLESNHFVYFIKYLILYFRWNMFHHQEIFHKLICLTLTIGFKFPQIKTTFR